VIPYIFLLVGIYKSPDVFPVNEKRIETEGIDPDLVELTPKEMGRRSSYDERNVLVHRRRSSIAEAMEELGLKSRYMEEDNPPSTEPTAAQKRLSQLVITAGMFETMDETEENDKKAIDVPGSDPSEEDQGTDDQKS
jgi:hypothetical protein